MSLKDLQAQLFHDAASKGGSADQVSRRYNEALRYLMGIADARLTSARGGGVELPNMVGTRPMPPNRPAPAGARDSRVPVGTFPTPDGPSGSGSSGWGPLAAVGLGAAGIGAAYAGARNMGRAAFVPAMPSVEPWMPGKAENSLAAYYANAAALARGGAQRKSGL